MNNEKNLGGVPHERYSQILKDICDRTPTLAELAADIYTSVLYEDVLPPKFFKLCSREFLDRLDVESRKRLIDRSVQGGGIEKFRATADSATQCALGREIRAYSLALAIRRHVLGAP